ncbi:MAG: radical SAM protein [Pseudomonadota bacterium]|nr:radical SAM protein [Pseudomonadota bacterium]
MERTLDFQDHRRDLGDNRYVYAVVSRRARGLSIGINLNPDKVCNFDCPYCQVDRTEAAGPPGSGAIDLDVLDAELSRLLGWVRDGSLWEHPPFHTVAPALRRVTDIAFAGDGEPTTPAAFPGAVARVRAARDRFGLDVPVRLLTNATMLHRERVKAALPLVDEVWAKLDAGTEAWYRRVDGTTFPFARILSNLAATAAYRPLVIQSMFCTLGGEGPSDAEIEAWVGRLSVIAAGGTIDHVQIYTVARKPSDPTVGSLSAERLEQIAARARAVGVRAESYGGV